jgi:hypothetical protein
MNRRNIRIGLIFVFLSAAFLFEDGFCGKVYLSADTKIDISLKSPISTKDPRPESIGAIFEVVSADSAAGIEVFRKGCRVFGRIVEFKQAGHLGKAGTLKISIDSVQTIQGKAVAVKSLFLSAQGKGKKLKAYMMLPLLGAGYFIKGDEAVLDAPPQPIPVHTLKFEEIAF